MITVIGNSHMAAIRHAAAKAGIEAKFYATTFVLDTLEDGTKQWKQPILERFLGSDGMVFSTIGGNAHNTFGMVRHPQPFDFIHPDYPNLVPTPKFAILPFAQIKDAMRWRSNTRVTEFLAVSKMLPGRLVHLESPPQVPNWGYLVDALKPRMIAAGKPNFSVSPSAFRYKLWRVNSEIFQEHCTAQKVPFIPVPPEACDENGFLRREYWRPKSLHDPTHANGKYGALVLEQIKSVLERGHAPSV